MSDLVGNPEDRFSLNEAQIKKPTKADYIASLLHGFARSASLFVLYMTLSVSRNVLVMRITVATGSSNLRTY